MMAFLITLFAYAALAYVVSKVAQLIWQLVRPAKNLSTFGSWTVITGATDGIGQAMAHQLAKKGQNLLIIGRNPDKLSRTVDEIKAKYSNIAIETLQIDLSQFHANKELQQKYISTIKDKDVGILINNAGLAYPYTNYLDAVDQQRVEDMIYVNNLSPTILIQQTIKSKFLNKRQSAIINISSAGSIVPHPLHCIYSATKSFLNKLSVDLASEYKSKGIAVQSQMPYFVVSKMSKIRRSSLTTPTAMEYAEAAVKQIGYNGLISPYPVHAVIFFLFDFIPTFILDQFVFNLHLKIKKLSILRLFS